LPKDLGIIEDIKFVYPKDMQDGTILISDGDITTNLPYVDGVHLAFDHHHSKTIRVSKKTITSSTLTRHRLRGLFMTITVAKRSSQVSLKI